MSKERKRQVGTLVAIALLAASAVLIEAMAPGSATWAWGGGGGP